MHYVFFALYMIVVVLFFGIPHIATIAEKELKIYKLSVDDQVFKIPYKTVNADVRNIEADLYFNSIYVLMTSRGDGTFELTVPRNLVDSKLDNEDHGWLILIDGEEERDYHEINTSHCFRTISISFPGGAEEIDVMPDLVYIPEDIPRLATEVPPVSITTDKSNYEVGESIRVSGCTDLALDDKEIILDVLNPEEEIYRTISIVPDMYGSFSTTLVVEGEDAVEGTYTAKATYAGESASGTFVVPEFPITIMIATVAIGLMLAIMRLRSVRLPSMICFTICSINPTQHQSTCCYQQTMP